MKQYMIALDIGTTNTRAVLLQGGATVASQSEKAGVRLTAFDSNNTRLSEAVRGCIYSLLETQGLDFTQISLIAAAGMISSNVGLCELPHLAAPAGLCELAQAITPFSLPDIAPQPIWVIPGVKNLDCPINKENFEQMDMMRGEETEAIALQSKYADGHALLLVLPGSHTKFIEVDRGGRITRMMTSISGELLDALTNASLLADSVGRRYADEEGYDREMMLAGYRQTEKCGLGRAAFLARILSQFSGYSPMQLASYLLGSVLQSDLAAIRCTGLADGIHRAVVAGKNPFRRGLADLLIEEKLFNEVVQYQPAGQTSLSALGAYQIVRKRGLID